MEVLQQCTLFFEGANLRSWPIGVHAGITRQPCSRDTIRDPLIRAKTSTA